MNIADHRLLQVWQWPTEDGLDFAGVLALCRETGATGVLVKGLDGNDWQASYNGHPDALRSAAQAVEQRERAHAAGLTYCVWTNPLFETDRLHQAAQTAALANVCDALFLDVEPYPQFWGAWRPEGAASNFMMLVRAGAPSAVLVLQPDPRPDRLAEIRPAEWLPHVNALAGQHYFETFEVDAEAEVAAALELAEEVRSHYGLPVLPTLPGAASAADLRRAIAALEAGGVRGRVLWRVGVTGAEALAAFGQTAAVPAPEQPSSQAVALAHLIEERKHLDTAAAAIREALWHNTAARELLAGG